MTKDNDTINATDEDWRHFGASEPYWSVLTDEKFKQVNLTSEAIHEFYDTGERHVAWVLDKVRYHIGEAGEARSALDFGCGVGRLTIPLARHYASVVGVDVSPSMLAKARERCESLGITNLRFFQSNDALSAVEGCFDLIISHIVLQHIPVSRGERLIARLIDLLDDRGVAALHLNYSKSWYAYWMHKAGGIRHHCRGLISALNRRIMNIYVIDDPDTLEKARTPFMQMNDYPLNRIFHRIQMSGVRRMHIEFTDHGGCLGLLLFFRKDAQGHYEA
jgi:2-polyprenyl-3-methyl-5-hydroxy-6-metoxy-1,4-benzoquinol methylase